MTARRSVFWFTISFLALTGIVLSVISLYHHTAIQHNLQFKPSFCNLGDAFNCDAVNFSTWSYLFGVPVASYGLAFYGFLFFISIWATNQQVIEDRLIDDFVFLLGVFASLYSIFLFLVAEFVIGTLCLVCLGMYLINFLVLGGAWYRYRDKGFSARLAAVAGGVKNFILVLLGKVAPTKQGARGQAVLACIVLVCLSLGAYGLPSAFLNHLQNDPALAKEKEQIISGAVKEWENQPVVQIPIRSGSSLEIDYEMGPAFAPVQIIEFADFECPSCRNFYPAVEAILRDYGDKIHYVYKNYPLDKSCNPFMPQQGHKNACYAAHFARCAGEQGRFWDAMQFLFTLNEFENESLPQKVRNAIDHGAVLLSLDTRAVQECMQSARHNPKILSDIEDGNKVGLMATPSIWINGKKLEYTSEEVLRAVLKRILDPSFSQ